MRKLLKKLFIKFGYSVHRIQDSTTANGQSTRNFLGSLQKTAKYQIDYKKVELGGDQYFVPNYALHRPAASELLNGNFYEPDTHEFVRYFCDLYNGSIVHAGAFFGDMIPSFSSSVSDSVYVFEPVLENYTLARLCVTENNLVNVLLFNAALSNDISNRLIQRFASDGRHAGGESIISDSGDICVATTIDSLNIENLVLIQLDVEGQETAALIGATKTIEKNRPVVAVEDMNNDCEQFFLAKKYDRVGEIPGLNLWAPSENTRYKDSIVDFLNSNS